DAHLSDENLESNTSEIDALENIKNDLTSETFDESTLTELLVDKPSDPIVELTPDFSDQNVLSGLLNDSDETNNAVAETIEIDDIQELDNLDFDELLANIEEESSVSNESVDFNQNLDIGDEISLSDVDSVQPNDVEETIDDDQNFVSVDSLLSASHDEVSQDEPYKKANIDVGLDEFSEFSSGEDIIDVDIDENGMAAKLDLAKVYLEIGDEDNAQVILQSVIEQGDTQQKLEAQSMLDKL
ncbi:MAG: FimV/HubP family polar landmark protein, partial [Colwellia sp.]